MASETGSHATASSSGESDANLVLIGPLRARGHAFGKSSVIVSFNLSRALALDIQANDVAQLRHRNGVLGQLELAHPMRLQTMRASDPLAPRRR